MATIVHQKTVSIADWTQAELDAYVAAGLFLPGTLLANIWLPSDVNANHLVSNIVNADISTTAAIDATKIANGNVTSTEFQYLDGVTSAIQTQFGTKVATANNGSDFVNLLTTLTNLFAANTNGISAQAYRPINAQTGTSYTLVLSDNGKMVTLSNASAITLTVPANASVAFAVNAEIDLAQLGAGQVTVAAAGGVTLNSYQSKVALVGQYAGATLKQTATDVWILIGNLA